MRKNTNELQCCIKKIHLLNFPVPTMQLPVVTTLVIALALCVTQGKKVTITKFENCDPNADYPIKITYKMKQENGLQVLEEASLSTKVALGKNINDIAEVSAKEDDGEYEHLITINENLCDAVNKYMGEFMHDMQEAAGIERGACPVPAGDYKIKEHALDFTKFKFKRIPEGNYRVKVTLIDSNSNETLHCHYLEFTIGN